MVDGSLVETGGRLPILETGVSVAVWMVDGSMVEMGGRLPILETGVSVAVWMVDGKSCLLSRPATGAEKAGVARAKATKVMRVEACILIKKVTRKN